MIVDSIRIRSISDIHLGHSNTKTEDIIRNLDKVLSDTNFGECDIFFIAGDFFDTLLNLPDSSVVIIKKWIVHLLKLCTKYNIILRILEGTPSHDWKQSKLFIHLNDLTKAGTDVKYIDSLSIEYIDKFGINVLYIPDEISAYCDDTWVEVNKLLAEHSLEKIDFIVMHGAFDYQFPNISTIDTHKSSRYLSIVKYLIFIGHVHTHTHKDRIIAPGSFDRLKHAEEEAKGYIEAVVKKNGNYNIVFVENKTAKIYKTIKCAGKTIEQAIAFLDKELEKLPEQSHIRIEANKDDVIMSSMNIIKREFPLFKFTTKLTKDSDANMQTIIDLKNSYKPIAITNLNIKKLIVNRIKAIGVSSDVLIKVEELIDEYV